MALHRFTVFLADGRAFRFADETRALHFHAVHDGARYAGLLPVPKSALPPVLQSLGKA